MDTSHWATLFEHGCVPTGDVLDGSIWDGAQLVAFQCSVLDLEHACAGSRVAAMHPTTGQAFTFTVPLASSCPSAMTYLSIR